MMEWLNTQKIQQLASTVLFDYGINIIEALVTLIIGWLIAKLIRSIVNKILSNKRFDQTVTKFFSDMIYFVLIAIVLITALSCVGVQTSSLVALLGAMALAIGLSLKNSISLFTSGLIVVSSRPFKVDQTVEIDGTMGKVQKISIMFTTLKSFDNQTIIMPNNKVLGAKIVNYTQNKTRRINLTIGIGYDSDIDLAKSLLMEIAQSDDRVLKDPAPLVAVTNLGDSSVDLLFRVWVKNADFQGVKFDSTETIKKIFDKNNINIPFPQRDVHMIAGN